MYETQYVSEKTTSDCLVKIRDEFFESDNLKMTIYCESTKKLHGVHNLVNERRNLFYDAFAEKRGAWLFWFVYDVVDVGKETVFLAMVAKMPKMTLLLYTNEILKV
jgi:hypothetical protein